MKDNIIRYWQHPKLVHWILDTTFMADKSGDCWIPVPRNFPELLKEFCSERTTSADQSAGSKKFE